MIRPSCTARLVQLGEIPNAALKMHRLMAEDREQVGIYRHRCWYSVPLCVTFRIDNLATCSWISEAHGLMLQGQPDRGQLVGGRIEADHARERVVLIDEVGQNMVAIANRVNAGAASDRVTIDDRSHRRRQAPGYHKAREIVHPVSRWFFGLLFTIRRTLIAARLCSRTPVER